MAVLEHEPASLTGNASTAEGDSFAGYEANNRAFFWIVLKTGGVIGVHIAFTVHTRAAVDRFYASGLSAGGRDNGSPGLRPHYHASYYGAFVFDPDRHNIEAVYHRSA